ncbi:MAG TPA: amidohydrolase family protein [Candidatus Limnocylindrales bacterium]|nr:amidohydrolase family protein [Candidatus Limnocylindrales bacterium]
MPVDRPRRVLYRDAALADGRSDRLQLGISVLVDGDRVAWIRPTDAEEDPTAASSLPAPEVVDAGGTTIVPGMVDGHSHLTMPGGSHWIDRGADPPEEAVATAARNAALMTQSGVRWARDVGSAVARDPVDGRVRALTLGVRDRSRGRAGWPNIRAAGTWIGGPGALGDLGLEAADGDVLVAAAEGQLDDGADFIKLYLDGADPTVSPWSIAEIERVVAAVHARGARVTAHSGRLDGATKGVAGGVDALEHGFELDAAVAAEMARRGTFLVSTLAVFRSWESFGATTTIERFTGPEGRERIAARRERAEESVRIAHRAGVRIATGTDFGGGSTRANQLAWEVEALVAAGLQPWEALGAATWRGGELLGEPDAGVLRDGGPADFSLVHGDPLSDPTALWRVWRVSWSADPVVVRGEA